MSDNDNVESAPATAHTNIDTSFGLMPLRRARSAFSADALTLFPNVVRVKNHARKIATSGTTIRIVNCAPVSRTDPRVKSDPIARGKRAAGTVMSGYAVASASESWAMPIVATSTMTRGALNNLRMMVSWSAAP